MSQPENHIDKLQRRAKRKYVGYPVVKHLLALDSPLKPAYLTTLSCSSSINTFDGKIISRYCKRTWCAVCSPIRTAVRINNYREQLEGLGDLQLTTLTVKNVQPDQIRNTIQLFRKVFRRYRHAYKKREGKVFRGVYNFECTYNQRTGLYHPHIHIIHECIPMDDKDANNHSGKSEDPEFFNDLCQYWVYACPDTSMKAQDTRICYDLIEGFKYQSLSVFKIKINGKKQPFIPVKELDIIYQQIKGLRCFQAFGINKIPEADEEKQMDELAAYETSKPDGVYRWAVHDWFLKDREDIALSDYIPSNKHSKYQTKLLKNEFYQT